MVIAASALVLAFTIQRVSPHFKHSRPAAVAVHRFYLCGAAFSGFANQENLISYCRNLISYCLFNFCYLAKKILLLGESRFPIKPKLLPKEVDAASQDKKSDFELKPPGSNNIN
jgi:hypothetical protein